VVKSFYKNMFELPIGIRRSFAVNESFGFSTEFGGGADINLTNSSSTIFNVTDDLNTQYKFINSTSPGAFSFIGISVYTRILNRSLLSFNLGYQYQFTSMYRFESRDNFFTTYGSNIKPSYLHFGITLKCFSKPKTM
jgi:hypothetical protein